MEYYNSGSIEVLHGLEPIRKRPSMYSDTAQQPYIDLANEIVAVSIEEAIRAELAPLSYISSAYSGFAENTAKPICFIDTQVELPQTTSPRNVICKILLSWTELLKVSSKLGREPPLGS